MTHPLDTWTLQTVGSGSTTLYFFGLLSKHRCVPRVQAPEGFNSLEENEHMISFHLSAIHGQLQQAYIGMALAVASGRAFISPKVKPHIQTVRAAHAVAGPAGQRLLGLQWEADLPGTQSG